MLSGLINEIPEIVKFYNERCSFRDGFEKSVANPNGFTTQDLAYKSHWRSFVSLCDSFNFVNIISWNRTDHLTCSDSKTFLNYLILIAVCKKTYLKLN